MAIGKFSIVKPKLQFFIVSLIFISSIILYGQSNSETHMNLSEAEREYYITRLSSENNGIQK